MPTRPAQQTGSTVGDRLLIAAVFLAAGCAGVLWLGAAASAWLVGSPVPHLAAGGLARLLRHPGAPSTAWEEHMPAPGWYWTITAAIALTLTALAVLAAVVWRRHAAKQRTDPRHQAGLATRHDVRRAASANTVLRKAALVRPSLTKPAANEVGYQLGHSAGRRVWISVEDSVIILGPPRSGKGLHLVIPMILDAPGAVVTTSTRPDNLTATLTHRARGDRPVAVFDPQRLAPDTRPVLRWSPIRGCEQPQTAMIRARALAAGTARGVDGGDFWQAQTEAVLRGFLHAAALDGRQPADLYRWSLSPVTAADAVAILTTAPGAAPGWAEALDAAISADRRTRDSIWVGVRTALACLADPRVLDAVTPRRGEHLDPEHLLRGNGTVYLIGTSAGAGAAANLIGAYLEDIAETARRLAAASPGARLDPPLALILDEVANYPLPSLPSLMSEGGGSGITTIAVLQSLAQARAKWGDHEGSAIWDSAIAKVILGGGSNARDLADLAALIGDRDEQTANETRDHGGHRSTSYTTRQVPIMNSGRLRTMPFGTGILLLRSAPPIILDLQPWARSRAAWRPLCSWMADSISRRGEG
jgi:type IV secretion system protein VirD4